jgi:pyruvate/2-oxoglutarate dehydrogenase complex dihydrolipoamide acyltransferase (E2) component
MAERRYTLGDLAPDLQDVTVSAWYVRPGQQVEADDDMLDVVTDKAAITLPVPAAGTVLRVGPQRDMPVGTADELITLEVVNDG